MVIKSLLIANRGEIAARIIKTARRMGIKTVAVYHADDAGLPFVSMADTAVCLGGGPLSETYLCGKKIVDIALDKGVDAVHPGYGFLSENADFANMCRRGNLIFVGPTPEVIAIMGDKITSRSYAQSLNIPVVRGFEGHPDEITKRVIDEDFPLLVKPALGGGGKGMKIARNRSELQDALATAAREAQRYFSSDMVFVEHLILFPRHIEVQIIADTGGNVLHLSDRECTLQRRFQKVVEEAPSPSLSSEQRRQAYDYAIALAKECGYVNAGTVEFLLDTNGKLYFLEMNTRLQVEHPVTEMVVNVDLVEWQIRIAMGEPLPLRQHEVKVSGCAIELRVIAEDAENGFVPSTGRLGMFSFPEGFRFDSGYQRNNEVTPHFDSLLGKLVVHAADRSKAIAKCVEAVQSSSVLGVKTNLSFLQQLLLSKDFAGNSIHTAYIDSSLSKIVEEIKLSKNAVSRHLLIAAFLKVFSEQEWKLFHQGTLLVDGSPVRFFAVGMPGAATVVVGRNDALVRYGEQTENTLVLLYNGKRTTISYHKTAEQLLLSIGGVSFTLSSVRETVSLTPPERGLQVSDRKVASPLNGKIVEVKVRRGQKVSKGTLLLVVESMKMENSIYAPADATIGEIFVEVSQQVQGGSTLLNLE